MGFGGGIPINGGDTMAIKTKIKKTKGDKVVVDADSDSETEVGVCRGPGYRKCPLKCWSGSRPKSRARMRGRGYEPCA